VGPDQVDKARAAARETGSVDVVIDVPSGMYPGVVAQTRSPLITPEPADMHEDDGSFDHADSNSYSAQSTWRLPAVIVHCS
jgi:hypothetical protein